MTDSEQNNKPISEPLKTPREKNSTPSSDNPSLVRYRNLGYNILKSLDDKAVRDIDFPELEPCSECNNDILTFPLREFTRLRCGHIFHRLCAEKKLMLNVPNPCPFPDCGKNVEITEIFSTTVNYPIGRLPESNVIIQDSLLSQSSGTSALTNMMSERFILTSPPMRMEGVENIGIQQMGSQLRCVKCSEDLSSYLPPLGFLRTFPHPPPKPLVYLTCKHIVHYNCIDNPRKLCPICPSTDMEIDGDDMVADAQESSTAQKKRSRESGTFTEKSSNKKVKKTGGKKVSSMLKKLIEELLTDVVPDVAGENLEEEASENETSNFLQLYDMIDSAESKNEDASQGLIYSYFDFGEAVFKRYKKLKLDHGKDRSQALVKSEVKKAIPEAKCSDEALRKRMERSKKVYKLFNSIGKEKIAQIKTTPPGFILNLTKDEKDYVMAEVLKQKLR